MKTQRLVLTEKQIEAALAYCHEVGYSCLPDDVKAICDAFDSGDFKLRGEDDGRERFAERSSAYC